MAPTHFASPTKCNPDQPQNTFIAIDNNDLDVVDDDDDDDDDDDSLLEISLGDAQHIASSSLSSSLKPQQTPTLPSPATSSPPRPTSPSISSTASASASNPCTLSLTDHQTASSRPAQPSPSPTPTQTHPHTKTPNLYINGLPPNFPEDELFALTAPFGEIRSVRTFTRHIGERSSGYGFVLFDNVLSAEKCIEGLRCYRNLHPSFSKQIHKIPGTAYAVRPTHAGSASGSISIPGSASASESGFAFSFNGQNESSCSGQSHGQGSRYTINAGESEESFKARMERLKDETSTNLYIEGLPLSIDEATMAALVSPYTIKSSRFFETKLSHPPRIIAFVRLETRGAAEEIIERLHGRMVRGWNDPGSRISVRFADTSEQRELRRAERVAREGDQSPGRLTIAQAALLNLCGQEYQAQTHTSLAPTRTQHQHHLQVAPTGEFVPSSISGSGSVGSDFEVNPLRRGTIKYPLAHLRGSGEYGQLPVPGEYHVHPHTHLQLQQHLQPHPQQLGHNQTPFGGRIQVPVLPTPYHSYSQDVMTPDISVLLDSQRRGALPFATHGHGHIAADDYAGELGVPAQTQVPMLGLGQVQARNGYTPAEELILRAHAHVNAARGVRAEHVRRGAMSVCSAAGVSGSGSSIGHAGVDIGMGVRAQRSVASTVVYPQQQRVRVLPPNMSSDLMSPLSEDDFHSNAAVQHGGYRHQFVVEDDGRTTRLHDQNIHSLSHDFEAISLLQQQHHQQQQQTLSLPYDMQAQTQTHEYAQNQNQHQNQPQNQNQTHAPHMRATTLPHLSSSSQGNNQHQRHYQHSSMSLIDGNRKSQNQHAAQNQHQNHTQNTKQNQKQQQTQYNTSNKNSSNIFGRHDSSNNSHHLHHGVHFTSGNNDHEQSGNAGTYDGGHYTHSQFKRGGVSGGPDASYDDMVALDNAASPPLVSPALTYSSRTPATLSPATPFFGSFGHAGETFEGPGVGVEGKKNLGGGMGGVGVVSASGGLGGQ